MNIFQLSFDFLLQNIRNVAQYFNFLLQSIHTVGQYLNWLFTKDEARALAYIAAWNFLIFRKIHSLYDAFYKSFLYEVQMLV